MSELHHEVSDAILDLCLFADQRTDLRRHVERLRDLRQSIDEGDWSFPDFDYSDGEPE